MIECLKTAKFPLRNDCVDTPRFRGEWNENPAVFFRVVTSSCDPETRIGYNRASRINHGKHLTCGGHLTEHLQSAFSNQRPAAFPAGNKVNDVNTTFFELREFELTFFPQGRGLIVRKCLFVIWHQPVQVDVRIDFTFVSAIVVLRVDFKYFDDQRFDILQVKLELNIVRWFEVFRTRGNKFQIDPFQQVLVFLRRKHGCPFFRIADSIENLNHRKLTFEVSIANVGRKVLEIFRIQ